MTRRGVTGKGMTRKKTDRTRVPDTAALATWIGGLDRPLSTAELSGKLGLVSRAAKALLARRLNALVGSGELLCDRRGRYGAALRADLVRGRVMGHPKGYGFLVPEAGEGPDLFLPVHRMRAILHGDRVLARVVREDGRGRMEGDIVEVLERVNRRVLGRYLDEGGVGAVSPLNRRLSQDLLVPEGEALGACHGDYVVAEITRQPDGHLQPLGRVLERLEPGEGVAKSILLALRSREIPCRWPTGVRAELRALPRRVTAVQRRGREDLRALPLVTIDGADARDFDDAVYCERRGRDWRLVVAIADVSHYVRPGTALDRAARERGNSTYFPGQAVHMLPEHLSQELCSLLPDEDRLCMACELLFSERGKLRSSRFFDGVMRSSGRLIYESVAAAVEQGQKGARRELGPLWEPLSSLYELYRVLLEARRKTGLIDFDTAELKVDLGPDGEVCSLSPRTRLGSHRLVEECMLASNVAAASLLHEQDLGGLYRVHDVPPADRLQNLRGSLGRFGLSLEGGGQPTPADYAVLLRDAARSEQSRLVRLLALRSLPLAVYSEQPRGHFGLNFPHYTHFTSPIRRYPDLVVHRMLRRCFRSRAPAGHRYEAQELHDLGRACSLTERRSEEAEREVLRWCKCSYLKDHIGEEFTGWVSGVQAFGLFVELERVQMDGLIHVAALPGDYYHYDLEAQALQGQRRGLRFQLAQPLRVRLRAVDMEERRVDLEWVGSGHGAR